MGYNFSSNLFNFVSYIILNVSGDEFTNSSSQLNEQIDEKIYLIALLFIIHCTL